MGVFGSAGGLHLGLPLYSKMAATRVKLLRLLGLGDIPLILYTGVFGNMQNKQNSHNISTRVGQ